MPGLTARVKGRVTGPEIAPGDGTMRHFRVFAGVLLLWGCQTVAPSTAGVTKTPVDHRPRISRVHDSATERATQAQLERLFDRYDLSPWSFTGAVQIDDDAIPHSHPVLTLHTRHLKDDLLLLSTYVHEQSHHYFEQHLDQTHRAIEKLETIFPDLPVGFPDGANDRESSYLHLMVIRFEHHAMIQLVGELQAEQVMAFWATDHYRALYRLMLEQAARVKPVMAAEALEPPHL